MHINRLNEEIKSNSDISKKWLISKGFKYSYIIGIHFYEKKLLCLHFSNMGDFYYDTPNGTIILHSKKQVESLYFGLFNEEL
jgi:hypothetical protein